MLAYNPNSAEDMAKALKAAEIFHYNPDSVKGKKNKLKVDQIVKAKPSLVDWYASHLVWGFGKKAPKNAGYSEDEKEIYTEDLHKIYIWSRAKLTGKMPKGIVSHYGGRDNDKGIDRKCVWIIFKFDTELGNILYGTYVNEEDLFIVKRKKKKSKGKRP